MPSTEYTIPMPANCGVQTGCIIASPEGHTAVGGSKLVAGRVLNSVEVSRSPGERFVGGVSLVKVGGKKLGLLL